MCPSRCTTVTRYKMVDSLLPTVTYSAHCTALADYSSCTVSMYCMILEYHADNDWTCGLGHADLIDLKISGPGDCATTTSRAAAASAAGGGAAEFQTASSTTAVTRSASTKMSGRYWQQSPQQPWYRLDTASLEAAATSPPPTCPVPEKPRLFRAPAKLPSALVAALPSALTEGLRSAMICMS